MSMFSSLKRSKLPHAGRNHILRARSVEARFEPTHRGTVLPAPPSMVLFPSPVEVSQGFGAPHPFKRHSSDSFVNLPYIKQEIEKFRCSRGTKPHFYKLSHQWGPSVRSDSRQKLQVPHLPLRGGFTLHSLWAQDKNDRAYNSGTSSKLDSGAITDIIIPLTFFWPNLVDCTNYNVNIAFWEREWENHGSFIGLKPDVYFGLAINLTMALPKDLGIPIGQKLKVHKVINEVSKVLEKLEVPGLIKGSQVPAEINCNKDENQTRQICKVRICINEDLKALIPCPKRFSGFCRSILDDVILPPFK